MKTTTESKTFPKIKLLKLSKLKVKSFATSNMNKAVEFGTQNTWDATCGPSCGITCECG